MTAETSRAESPPLPPYPEPRRPSRQTSVASEQRRNQSVESSRRSSRASSRPRPVLHQPQPIHDAIGKAFSESSNAATVDQQPDPALVSKIVEQVLQTLSKQNQSDVQTEQYPPPPPPVASYDLRSPVGVGIASFQTKFTPPASPDAGRDSKARDDVEFSGAGFDADDKSHMHLVEEDRDERTPRPQNPTPPQAIRSSRAGSAADLPYPEAVRSSRTGSSVEPLYKTTSAASQPRHDSTTSSPIFADWEDVTAIETAWQPLFDKNGSPRERLGHFLRGLALHLIEDYEPKDSLVITPAKMQRFFKETVLADEQYPWNTIFSDISWNSLSTIYQQLRAQHHCVQVSNHSSPSVPALTPHGFECFMTCLIQAHPEHEYKRISQALEKMPITSAEDRKFRWPKQLSRRQFPARPNMQAAQRLTASMAHEPKIQLKNPTHLPPPPPPQQDATISPATQIPDRRPQPYSRRPNSSTFDDEDLAAPDHERAFSLPIERERKPYTAREGSGKVHATSSSQRNQSEDRSRPVRQPSNSNNQERPPRQQRQNSNGLAHTMSAPSDPRAIPNGERPRAGNGPPLAFNNFSRGMAGSYPRSEASFSGSEAAYPSAPSSTFSTDDADRRTARRQTMAASQLPPMDDPRGRPIPEQYEGIPYSHNMPPQLPPLGTSFPSQRSQPLYDERRRSAYSAAPGGTDGWGSFASNGSYGGDSGR